ncbi:ferric reductase-like transmembrane domain-containing protein [Kineococcus arenarius]|uniref:ferric reductase-like transmembrane domain-containing protein n=1 Tax=unclassified Kineococcus TaxID=2621656 RepID=UPI003D7DE171
MNAELLWYVARASGLVLLPLFTAVVVLGVLTRGRRRPAGSPRFATLALHRSLALAALAFVAVHVGSVVADSYVDVTLVDVVVPFASGYRPYWTGLGTLALLLLAALIGTSLARVRLGQRAWRGVHALSWVFFALTLAHGLGAGSDTRTWWGLALSGACAVAVALAVVLGRSRPRWRPVDPPRRPAVLEGAHR